MQCKCNPIRGETLVSIITMLCSTALKIAILCEKSLRYDMSTSDLPTSHKSLKVGARCPSSYLFEPRKLLNARLYYVASLVWARKLMYSMVDPTEGRSKIVYRVLFYLSTTTRLRHNRQFVLADYLPYLLWPLVTLVKEWYFDFPWKI